LLHKRPRRVHIGGPANMVASFSRKWHSRGPTVSALLCLGYAHDVWNAVTIAYMLWYLPVMGICACRVRQGHRAG
jgi:hypothetical protein